MRWLVFVLALLVQPLFAAEFPYNEATDARVDVERALVQAAGSDRLVMIVFGANWCTDCRVLDAAMSAQPLAGALAANYVLVKVDIGNWDKHVDVAARFGDPISKGIPALIVADSHGDVLYATRAGELATARDLGAEQLTSFFEALPRRATTP